MFIGLFFHLYDVFSDFQYHFVVPFANGDLRRSQLAFVIIPMAFFLLKILGDDESKSSYHGERTRSAYQFFGAGDFYAVDYQDELRAIIDEREKKGLEVDD